MDPILLAAALTFAAGVPPSSSAQAAPPPMRVFVRTDDTGDGEELAGRQQSVKDLAEALAGRKKYVVLVEDRREAQIVLDIVDRGVTVPRVVFGMGARPGQPPGGSAPARTAVQRVELAFDGDELVLRNKNTAFDNPRGWKSAADDIAKQVQKWIEDRRKEGFGRASAPPRPVGGGAVKLLP
jgi:hypothetical protein